MVEKYSAFKESNWINSLTASPEKRNIRGRKPPTCPPTNQNKPDNDELFMNLNNTPKISIHVSSGIEDILSFTSFTSKSKTPKPIRKERSLSKGEIAAEALFKRAETMTQKKNKMAENYLSQTCTFKPQIDQKSINIVKKALQEGRDIKNISKERKREESLERKRSESLEKKQANGKLALKGFLERNYNRKIDQLKEKTAYTPPPPKDGFEECTFTPKINQASVEMVRSIDLYQKALLSQRKINEKREDQKLKAREEEMEPCTFHPELFKPLIMSPMRSITPRSSTPKRYSETNSPRFSTNIEF
ncbi:unnamed protein product [Blepharisma stoltei]|uniref:TPX2 C-terminal domain-containing protein n=1 Tax=Blepharisma stoltei TaxID=1481888 RepID=A0AAU9KBR4_9CILI|nr:unnamed protein product [Blepharisma stoltei]